MVVVVIGFQGDGRQYYLYRCGRAGASVFDYLPVVGHENVGRPRSKRWKSVPTLWAVESKFPWRVWGSWAIFGQPEPQALPNLPDLT